MLRSLIPKAIGFRDIRGSYDRGSHPLHPEIRTQAVTHSPRHLLLDHIPPAQLSTKLTPSKASVSITPASDSTMLAQDELPLLRLPPELRNCIYRTLFNDAEISLIDTRIKAPGILLTCKQTHQESIGLFYNETTFTSRSFCDIETWLTGLPTEYLRLVRDVRCQTRRATQERTVEDLEFIALQLDGISYALVPEQAEALKSGATKASVWTRGGEMVWTSTPVLTYLQS